MALATVIAFDAPPGAGTATWDDGDLKGDPAILDEAKKITHVIAGPESAEEPVDWSKSYHALDALHQAARRVYGGKIDLFQSRPKRAAVTKSQAGIVSVPEGEK